MSREKKVSFYPKYDRHSYKCNFTPDYKDVSSLRGLVTETGKIVPSRVSGASAKFQRHLSNEIKRARYLALIPYCDRHS